jgi:hypothetical protein
LYRVAIFKLLWVVSRLCDVRALFTAVAEKSAHRMASILPIVAWILLIYVYVIQPHIKLLLLSL